MAMQVAIRRQHFGQAVKAAARRDERNDTVNNLVTIQSEREGRRTDDADDNHG